MTNHSSQSTSAHLDQARRVLRAEADAVAKVCDHLDEQFDRAVRLLAECTGTVIVCGVGKSGLIAQKISATLASTGTPSHFLHPTEAMHGDLGRIQSGDVVIGLSYSGGTEDVLALVALVRQDDVPVISISCGPGTHLAKISNVPLAIGDVTEACSNRLAPTASTTAMLALGDALAIAASDARNFTADEFHKRHPGGNLGRQLLPVMEVLRFRAGSNLPLIDEGLTVKQVLSEANAQVGSGGPRRAGVVLLVDGSEKLTGILTDGDLRRLLLSEGDRLLDQPVAQLMTRNPRTLGSDAIVRDAVQLMREHRLDEIPIVDDDAKPLGLIDVQDLIAMKVIEG